MLEEGDRRFNIGDWQNNKVNETTWWPGDDKIIEILTSELKAFTLFLKSLNINKTIINRIVENDARDAIIDISLTNTDLFFIAFRKKDWQWMLDNISEKDWLGNSRDECKSIIQSLHTEDRISRKMLQKLYLSMTHIEKTPTGFSQLCKRNGLRIKKMRFNNQVELGIDVK